MTLPNGIDPIERWHSGNPLATFRLTGGAAAISWKNCAPMVFDGKPFSRSSRQNPDAKKEIRTPIASLRRGFNSRTFQRLFWTLFDQGVVSAGSFCVQLVLARKLSPADYGAFALVYGGLLTLQVCNATLIFHPMSVRVSAATDDQRPSLLGASLSMLAVMSLALGMLISGILIALGHAHLVAPALICFAAWQAQEGMRRGLICSIRHASAIPGDAVCYFGQAGMAITLALRGLLTVDAAFYGIAVCAGAGAIVHSLRLIVDFPSKARFREILIDFWAIGGIPSLGNGLLSTGRNYILPWTLAVLAGPAATAGYQAAANIVNLSNPLILGLGNIIPQAAASAGGDGYRSAWQAVRGYLLLSAPPLMVYCCTILAVPGEVLALFYGAGSHYAGLELPLRILVLTGPIALAIEGIIGFLHGLALVRWAVLVNIVGAAVTVCLIPPLVGRFGLAGGCVALLLANLARFAVVQVQLTRLTHPSQPTTDAKVP